MPIEAISNLEILCWFSHPRIILQGLGSLVQDTSIVHVFLCFGNKKTYATVAGAALTAALLASLFSLSVVCFMCLCKCLYFYSQDFSSWKSKGHCSTNASNFLWCSTLLQIPCASEIPRISRILSLSFVTVFHSEIHRLFIPGEFISKSVQETSASGLFCELFWVSL